MMGPSSRGRVLVAVFILFSCLHGTRANSYFAIVNDIHYDPTYRTTQESCNVTGPIPHDSLGYYGDVRCDSPWELVESAISAIQTEIGTPDFIVWNGDNLFRPAKGSSAILNKELILEVIQNITDLMKARFVEVPGPLLPSIGNTDWFPAGQIPSCCDDFYEALGDMWGLGETFKKGGYYSQYAGGHRVIILNTNLYNRDNDAVQDQNPLDPGGQLAWLEDTLNTSRAHGEKAQLFMHLPPGVTARDERFFRDHFNNELTRIIRKFSDVIIASHASHLHTDTFRLFYDDDGNPISTMFISPSVTPRQNYYGTSPEAVPRNPGFRKVTYDNNIIDIFQYYFDLDEANKKHAEGQDQPSYFQWQRLYSFRGLFGVPDMSPSALDGLLQDFKHAGTGHFPEFLKYHTLLAECHTASCFEACTCDCKSGYLCAIQHVDYENYTRCLPQEVARCEAESPTGRGVSTSLDPVAVVSFCLFSWLISTFR